MDPAVQALTYDFNDFRYESYYLSEWWDE